MSETKQPISCDTLENIERFMPALHEMFSRTTKNPTMATFNVVAPLAQAIATLAREVRELRDRQV